MQTGKSAVICCLATLKAFLAGTKTSLVVAGRQAADA
jgi:hypothetical protein